jgi:hypothetical protein
MCMQIIKTRLKSGKGDADLLALMDQFKAIERPDRG